MNFYQANKITNDFKYQLEGQRYRRQQMQKQLEQIRKAQQSLAYQNSQAIESFYAKRQAELEAQRKAKMEAQQMAAYYNANAQAQEAAALEVQKQIEKFNDVNNYGELNSVADLIFNWGADYTLQDYKRYLSNLPTARLLAAGGNLLTGNVDKAKDNAKAALVNGLYALGEDADMVANIVKSQTAAKDKSDRLENLKSTVGLSEKYGIGNRINYDYDTGSFGKDLVLEFISDPLNIIEFGAKGVAVLGAKSLAKELPEVVAKNAPELATEIMQKAAKKTNKFLIRDVTRNILDGNSTTIKQAIKNVSGTIDAGTDIGKASLRYLKLLDTSIEDDLISGVAKGAGKIYHAADKLDSGLLKIGLTEIGVYPTYRVAKWALNADPHLKMHKANAAINKIQRETLDNWDDARRSAYQQSGAIGLPIDTQVRLFSTIKEDVPDEFEPVVMKQIRTAFDDTRKTLQSLTDARMQNDPDKFNEILTTFLKKEDCSSLAEYINLLATEKDLLYKADVLNDNTNNLLSQQLKDFIQRYDFEKQRILDNTINPIEPPKNIKELLAPEILDTIPENKGWELILGKEYPYLLPNQVLDYSSPMVNIQSRQLFSGMLNNKLFITDADRTLLKNYIDVSDDAFDSIYFEAAKVINKINDSAANTKLDEKTLNTIKECTELFNKRKSTSVRKAALNKIYDVLKDKKLSSVYDVLPPKSYGDIDFKQVELELPSRVKTILSKTTPPTEYDERILLDALDDKLFSRNVNKFLEQAWFSLGLLYDYPELQKTLSDLIAKTYNALDAISVGMYTGSMFDIFDNLNTIAILKRGTSNINENYLAKQITEQTIKNNLKAIAEDTEVSESILDDVLLSRKSSYTVDKETLSNLFTQDNTAFTEALDNFETLVRNTDFGDEYTNERIRKLTYDSEYSVSFLYHELLEKLGLLEDQTPNLDLLNPDERTDVIHLAQNFLDSLQILFGTHIKVDKDHMFVSRSLQDVLGAEADSFFTESKKLRRMLSKYQPSELDSVVANKNVDNLVIANIKLSEYHKTTELIKACNPDDTRLAEAIENIVDLTKNNKDIDASLVYAEVVQVYAYNNLKNILDNFFKQSNNVDFWGKQVDINKLITKVMDRFCNYYTKSIDAMTGVDTDWFIRSVVEDIERYHKVTINAEALTKVIEDNYIQVIKNAGGGSLSFAPSIGNMASDLKSLTSTLELANLTRANNTDVDYLFRLQADLHNSLADIYSTERRLSQYSIVQTKVPKYVTYTPELDHMAKYDDVIVDPIETADHTINAVYSKATKDFKAVEDYDGDFETNSWFGLVYGKTEGMLTGKKNTFPAMHMVEDPEMSLRMTNGLTTGKDGVAIDSLIKKVKGFKDLVVSEQRYNRTIKQDPEFFSKFKTTILPAVLKIIEEVNPDCFYNFKHINLAGLNLTDTGYYQLTDWLINTQIVSSLYYRMQDGVLDDAFLKALGKDAQSLTYSEIKNRILHKLVTENALTLDQVHALLDPEFLSTDKILTNNTYTMRNFMGTVEQFSKYDDVDAAASTLFELETDEVPNEIMTANWLGKEKEQVLTARETLRTEVEDSKAFKDWDDTVNKTDKQTLKTLYDKDEQNHLKALTKTIDDGNLTQFLVEETPGFVVVAPNTYDESAQFISYLTETLSKDVNKSIGFKQASDETIIIYLKKGMDTSVDFTNSKGIHKVNTVFSSQLPKLFGKRISGAFTSTRLNTKAVITDFFNQLPKEIQNDMLINPNQFAPVDLFTNTPKRFSYTNMSFDNTFFGSANAINSIYKYNCSNLENRIKYMYSMYLNNISAKQAADVLYMSDTTRLSFNNMFNKRNLTDKEIAQHFKQHTELVGVYWTTNKQGRRVPKVMKLTDPKAVALARNPDLNPLIIDRATAANFIKQSQESKLKYNIGWNTMETIVSCLKAGYLSSPGWVMRNFTSTITKALLDASEDTDIIHLIPEAISVMHDSIKRINRYTECYSAISAYGLKNPTKYIANDGLEVTNNLIKDFFEDPVNAEWLEFAEDFDFIKAWTTRGYSDAMTKVLAQQEANGVIKGQSFISSLKNLDDRLKKSYPKLFDAEGNPRTDIKNIDEKLAQLKRNMFFTDFAWKNPYTSMLVGANNSIETYCRFFTLNWHMQHGADIAEAAEHVRKAHFDYTPTSELDTILNTVVPFLNFKINNTQYWLDMLFEHPWLTKAIMDFYKAGEFYDLSREQVTNEDYSVQQILDGAVKIPIEDSNGLEFKLNGDYIDALQTALNPIGTLTDSMLGIKTLKVYIQYKNQRDKVEQEYLKQKELNRLYKLAESGISPDYRKTKEQLKASEDHYLNSLNYLDKQTDELFLGLIPFHSLYKTVKNIFRDDAQNSFMDYITSNNLDDKLEGITKLAPSIISHNNKLYYYSFDNINVRTKDYAKYLEGLERGAKEGWAGISQPILPAKTYYAISFPNGKSFVSADLNKVTEWLHRGGLPVNDEARLLADSLDIDREVYGSTYYEDYQKQVYTQTNLAKREAYITSKYGPRRTKYHKDYVPKYTKPIATENVLGIAPINEPTYTNDMRPRTYVRPIRTLHNTYKNKRPIDTLAYRKRGR